MSDYQYTYVGAAYDTQDFAGADYGGTADGNYLTGDISSEQVSATDAQAGLDEGMQEVTVTASANIPDTAADTALGASMVGAFGMFGEAAGTVGGSLAAATEAGAAIGAFGGPVGLVVGLAVGALVYYWIEHNVP